MTRGVSMAHARRLARNAPAGCTGTARVDEHGIVRTRIAINVEEARLRAGRPQRLRAVLYEEGSLGEDSDPKPIPSPHGRGAMALPLRARVARGQRLVPIALEASVPGREGALLEVALERVADRRVPAAIASAAVIAAGAAALLLGSWGDPTARRGHYEGKTTEEIQRDLDTDVAWYAMEISVASRVTMSEGSTSCELRVENVEANHCDQKVRVWESGHEDDVLFESGAIAPGEYLQTVELAHPLSVGAHTLTVQFQGYEREATLLSDEGVPLGHDTFGASCAAEVSVEVTPADGAQAED